jgi:hypothetical protein
MGLFLDSNALPPVLFERLGIRQKCDAGKKQSDGNHPGGPAQAAAETALSERKKNIILAILKKAGECGKTEVKEFLDMHPGLRALRYRNYESSLWTDGSWKKELGRLIAQGKRLPSGFERADLIADEIDSARTQFGSLCFDLGINEPSGAEMQVALMQPGELAESQAAFFRKAAAEDGALQKELDDFKSWAKSLQPDALRHAWRRMELNIVTAASVVHKMRFRSAPFTSDEESFARNMMGKAGIDKLELAKLSHSFSHNHAECRELMERIVGLVKCPAEPLLDAARKSSDFDTLLDFLSIPREKNLARISKTPGFTKPHSVQDEQHPDNDDALTSISLVCQRMDGKTYYADLDVVFDGVSGHGGASVASRIAKDAFEISALAGWISWAEEARFATVLADLAINLEKARLKALAGKASGEDRLSLLRLQGMGTTMAASYAEGDEPYSRKDFYGIHCGDSDYKLVRRGDVIFKSEPHGVGNTIWSGLGIGAIFIKINNEDSCYSPIKLMDGDAVLTFTDGIGDVLCDHEEGSLVSAHPGDAAGLAAAIVNAADFRMDVFKTYKPGCSCDAIGGKDDDKTLISRFIKLDMPKKKP